MLLFSYGLILKATAFSTILSLAVVYPQAERLLGFLFTEESLMKLIGTVPVAFLDPPFSFWSRISLSLLEVAAAAAMPGNAALLSRDQAPVSREGGSCAGVQDFSVWFTIVGTPSSLNLSLHLLSN